jgi:hypothetical protein
VEFLMNQNSLTKSFLMKKTYSFLLSFSFILLFTAKLAANKDGTVLMSAILTPGQEVPAVTNTPKAKGLLTVIIEKDLSLTINGVFDSLSGPITNCHFHRGILGEATAGNVVLDLKQYLKGNRIYGKIPTISKTLLTQLMTDSIYINVHTALNTGGEIRGQVLTRGDYHYWTIMSGQFEIPAVTTSALGLASIVASRTLTRIEYKIVVNGLSGAITMAHLHRGSSIETGPADYTLTANGSVLSGTLTNVSERFIDSLNRGLVYVNIHTAANPTGEIRGQLSFTGGAFGFDAMLEGLNEVPAVTSNAKGLAIGWATENLDSLQYAILYTGITTTAAHFHLGAATATGGTISTTLPPYSRAPSAAYIGKIGFGTTNMTRFLMDSIYVNLHSTAFPNGEIRGQMKTTLHEGMVADLCGKQEVPAVTSPGFGAGYVSIDRTKSVHFFSVYTTGLATNASSGHIHAAPKGVSGDVIYNIGIENKNFVNGAFTFPRTTLSDTITNGVTYFNIHTPANLNGEIRGQLGKALTPDCLPTAIFELNGEKLTAKVFPNPANDAVNLVFGSNQAFDSQIVVSDLMGRSVSVKNFKVENGENQLPISVSNLSNGLYFIQLKNNGKVIFSEKIVKE